MHSLCVLLTVSNGEGALFHTLDSPESLSQDPCGLFYFPKMGAKRCLFSVLMCLSAVGASVWGLYHSSFTFTWECSHLARIAPGNSFVVEFSQEASPSERGACQPPLEVSLSHPEEPEGLNKAALWLPGILAGTQHPCHLPCSLTLIVLAFIFMGEDWIS